MILIGMLEMVVIHKRIDFGVHLSSVVRNGLLKFIKVNETFFELIVQQVVEVVYYGYD